MKKENNGVTRPKSLFQIEKVTPTEVWIRDIGNHACMPTVTNDAEAVVAFLEKMYPNHAFYYYDSEGEPGQLMHEHGVFRGFAYCA